MVIRQQNFAFQYKNEIKYDKNILKYVTLKDKVMALMRCLDCLMLACKMLIFIKKQIPQNTGKSLTRMFI
jgi:hypothetical protein